MASSRCARMPMAMVIVALAASAGCTRGGAKSGPGPGVAVALAESRARAISDLTYRIRFDIPAARDSAVTGIVVATFDWTGAGQDLILDFRAPAENVGAVLLDGQAVVHRPVQDHVVIPGAPRSR